MSESPTTAPRALERTKVKPILFSGPMVRALLDGRKSQTRRVLKPQPVERPGLNCRNLHWFDKHGKPRGINSPEGPMPWIFTPYEPGDLLWVRETWGAWPHMAGGVQADSLRFRADGEYQNEHGAWQWRPSIHMPKWASRLTLEVTAVKVERLAEISEEDAKAEGIKMEFAGIGLAMWKWSDDPNVPCATTPQGAFVKLWDHLNAKRGYGWEANPWVCAIAFNVHKMNVDAFLAQREAA